MNKTTAIDEEYFPLVNEHGETIGRATRRECHSGTKRLHPVVHLHVFNTGGELYLQQRAMNKDIQPGKWDTSAGGHVNYGEKTEDALLREAREELGITGFRPEKITVYIFESAIEKELVYTFRTVYDGIIRPDRTELSDGRFRKINEIVSDLDKQIFTPNFEYEFRKIIYPLIHP